MPPSPTLSLSAWLVLGHRRHLSTTLTRLHTRGRTFIDFWVASHFPELQNVRHFGSAWRLGRRRDEQEGYSEAFQATQTQRAGRIRHLPGAGWQSLHRLRASQYRRSESVRQVRVICVEYWSSCVCQTMGSPHFALQTSAWWSCLRDALVPRGGSLRIPPLTRSSPENSTASRSRSRRRRETSTGL